MKNLVTTWFAVDFSKDLGPVTFRHQACVQICHAQHVMAEIRENPSGPSWMRHLMLEQKDGGFLEHWKKMVLLYFTRKKHKVICRQQKVYNMVILQQKLFAQDTYRDLQIYDDLLDDLTSKSSREATNMGGTHNNKDAKQQNMRIA